MSAQFARKLSVPFITFEQFDFYCKLNLYLGNKALDR